MSVCPRTVLSTNSILPPFRSPFCPRVQNTTEFTPSATSLVTVNVPVSVVSPRNYKATSFSYYRERNGDTQFTSLAPAAKYQRLKLTHGTVRIPASQYTENRASLSAYQHAGTGVGVGGHGVCWNQMSDRLVAHVQPGLIASGSNPGGSSTRRSTTRLRPGALVPGGSGVDIKHNSYERRLLRLKARTALLAKPILNGGMLASSSPPVVAGCQCVPPPDLSSAPDTSTLMSVPYHWSVGQWVRAPTGNEPGAIYGYAVITALLAGGVADVSFAVTDEVFTVPVSSLIPSYPYHPHPFYNGEVVLTTQVPGDDELSVGLVIKITADGLYLVMFLDGTTDLFEASQLRVANPHAYPSFLFANVSTLVASVHHAQSLAAFSQNNGIVSLGSQAVSDINTLQWQNVIDKYRNQNNQEGE
jgi:hypothetical protein